MQPGAKGAEISGDSTYNREHLMKGSTKTRLRAKLRQLKGKAQQVAGKIEDEGGKVQQRLEQDKERKR
jgi:uncharacterized protein YjbJ (UPF0337 family)